MRKQLIFVVCVLYHSSVLSQGRPYVLPYFVMDTFNYSEPYSIHNAIYGEEESFVRGDTVLTHNWGEMGVTYKNFGIGYVHRYDTDLQFSEDTAEFYHLINNRKPLPEGREFDLRLNAKQYRTEGIRLSYTFELVKKTRLAIGLSYLKGLELTDGSAQGNATILDQGDYDFQFDVDYYYSKDFLFERKVDSPQGQGYSLDFYFDWAITQSLNFKLRGIDVVGKLYWENAPNTTATATSAFKEYDRYGYVIYQPVLSGYESNYNFTQKLKAQYKAIVDYEMNSKLALLGQAYSFYAENFYQVGLRYSFDATMNMRALYMFDTEALSIGYEMKYVNFLITSDSFNVDQTNTFAFSLNILTTF
ncbi:hypothetical protein [Kaarinaea lacus]